MNVSASAREQRQARAGLTALSVSTRICSIIGGGCNAHSLFKRQHPKPTVHLCDEFLGDGDFLKSSREKAFGARTKNGASATP